MGPSKTKTSFLYNRDIFHFHDYGRRGKHVCSDIYIVDVFDVGGLELALNILRSFICSTHEPLRLCFLFIFVDFLECGNWSLDVKKTGVLYTYIICQFWVFPNFDQNIFWVSLKSVCLPLRRKTL